MKHLNLKKVKYLLVLFMLAFALLIVFLPKAYADMSFDDITVEPSTDSLKITLENEGGEEANTVFYVKKGGKLPTLQELETILGKSVIPHKAGWEFRGFYTKQDCEGVKCWDEKGNSLRETYDYSFPASYWAGWLQCVTLTVNPNNGSSNYNIYSKRLVREYYSDNKLKTKITKLAVPTKSGYNFLGYYTISDEQFTDSNGNFTSFAYNSSYGGTLTAKWENPNVDNTIKVTATPGEGIKNLYISTVSYENLKVSDLIQCPGRITKGASVVYLFVTLQKGYPADGVKYKEINGVQYYQWKSKIDFNSGFQSDQDFGSISCPPAKASVSFDPNGGTATYTPYNGKDMYYGTIVPTLFEGHLPTKENYTFIGYFDQLTGGTQYYDGNLTPLIKWDKEDDGDYVLYAQYIRDNFTITLNSKGGTPDNLQISCAYEDALPDLSQEQIPTKTGNAFNGYFDRETGGKQYYDANGKSASILDVAEDIILYAQWGLDPAIQDAIDKIDAIGTVVYPTSKDKIVAAETAYAALTDEFKAAVDNYSTLVQARSTFDSLRATAISNTITLIDAIGEVVYPYSGDAIVSAETAYANLDENDKNEITNYAILTAARAEFEAQKSTVIDRTIAAIDAIGTVSYPESSEAIKNANNLYNSLNSVEKEGVTNHSTLVEANNAFNPLRENAINNVIALIDKIVEVTPLQYPDVEAKITAARSAYDALAESDKDITIITNLQTLLDSEVVYDLIDYIYNIGPAEDTLAFREKVSTARTKYNSLTDNQKLLFPSSFLDNIVDLESAISVMDKINEIGDVEYTQSCKAKIDAASDAYDALNAEVKPLVANYDKLVEANTDYNNVHQSVTKINNLPEFEYTSEYKELLDDAKEYYDNLTDNQKSIMPEDVVEKLNAAIDKYNAYDVIYNLGDVENTPESLADIKDAKEIYDSLSDEDKAIMPVEKVNYLNDAAIVVNAIEKINAIKDGYQASNKQEIEEAKEVYKSLSESQNALMPQSVKALLNDRELTYNIMVSINDISTVKYNDAYKTKLDSVSKKYNALTDGQKAMVKNYDTLSSSEKSYTNIDNTVKAINSIENVKYDDKSKQSIDDARNKYNNLTDEEKKLVNNTDKLVDSEKEYEEAKHSYEVGIVWIIVISSILGVALVGFGIWLLVFFILKKRNEKAEEENKSEENE